MKRLFLSAQMPKIADDKPPLRMGLVVDPERHNRLTLLVGPQLAHPIEAISFDDEHKAISGFTELFKMHLMAFQNHHHFFTQAPQRGPAGVDEEETIISLWTPATSYVASTETVIVRRWRNNEPIDYDRHADCPFKISERFFISGDTRIREGNVQIGSTLAPRVSDFAARAKKEINKLSTRRAVTADAIEVAPHYCNLCGDARVRCLGGVGEGELLLVGAACGHETRITKT